ncbi:hypothetical protein GLOTRDRAFT_139698 [Gloeophyllum trabeum ATCC 11539]|uniref:DUF6534 domain-containing protein n=1 Tax=Gloeophyllum trabeum (strain ATCC 11539 / FP-39264 / Madison 617) TaxID=670483 RepID=S7Q1Q3_GLOTA|nr:uncharacterized protein GLOTRDRAFT_139698 [Gloeophyllum trabeum ATCC 11539]EPQ53462.1 hypothetical protein GLOTRDRAFT_139698 [Gloeophyllum trabeum ATCC 11539]
MAASPATVAHGPAIIGLFFNILLYGIMITQTFLYFKAFQNDKAWMKCYVVFLFVADTVNTIFDCIWMYQSVIIHFGDLDFLSKANWVFAADPAMTGIIACLVQFFFAWRIKILTGSWLLVVAVVVAALGGGLGGVGTAIAVGIIPQFAKFQEFQAIVIVWLISNAVCDVLITTALTWHLRRHKTGFPATDDIVNKIIRLTVQTGMITALVATLDVAFFVGSTSGLHLAFNFPLSKLYTNSLMSTLNSRTGWKYNRTTEPSGGDPEAATGHHLSGHREASRTRKPGVLNLSQGRSPEVFVHVESHQMVDLDNKENGALYPDAEDDGMRSAFAQSKGTLSNTSSDHDIGRGRGRTR